MCLVRLSDPLIETLVVKMFPSVDVLGFNRRRESFFLLLNSPHYKKKRLIILALTLRAVDSLLEHPTEVFNIELRVDQNDRRSTVQNRSDSAGVTGGNSLSRTEPVQLRSR